MTEPGAPAAASSAAPPDTGAWAPARAENVRAVPDRVDVWLAWRHTLSAAQAVELVSEEDRRWLDAVVAPPARQQRLHARAALRSILAGYLRVPPRRVGLARDERGKPHVQSDELEISLSHTAGCSLIAISVAASVGVDIERWRRTPSGSLHRFLSRSDQRVLDQAAPGDRDRTALGLWTRKEAVAKATGRAVGALATLTVADTGLDHPTQVGVGCATVRVETLRPERGYVAALARFGPERATRCSTWMP